MIIASGFLVVDLALKDRVLQELGTRGVELHGEKGEKIIFLAEGENAMELKATMDSLQGIEGVQGLYLAYFSLEDTKNERWRKEDD